MGATYTIPPASLPPTRRIERPRLEPKALPSRWRLEAGMLVHVSGEYQMELDELEGDELTAGIILARDVVQLLEWLRHQRAVEAQEAS